jgi:hypothetical protein
MAYTFEELQGKTVAELREIAKGIDHEAVQGKTQMNKARLLAAICQALSIEMREHHQVVGMEKGAVKARIRDLKGKRAEALAAHDHALLKKIRAGIRKCKRELRRATV